MKVKLTNEFILSGLYVRNGKPKQEFCHITEDPLLKGAYINVQKSTAGQGVMKLRKKISGVTKHFVIGKVPTEISLDQGFDLCREMSAKLQLGQLPTKVLKADTKDITLTEFFENHYLPYKKDRKRSWKDDESIWRLRIKPDFGNKKLSEITRHQIDTWHTSIKDKGLSNASANRGLVCLKHMLQLCVDWGMLDKNPGSRLKLLPEPSTEVFLKPDELKRLVNVLDNTNTVPALVFKFLLMTGSRLNEALKAKWSDIVDRTWTIPMENSKSKKTRAVPLNDGAMEVLGKLTTKGNHEYLFVNQKTGKRYVQIYKAWLSVTKRAGLCGLRCHDLRHTAASYWLRANRNLREIQLLLGHQSYNTTTKYARCDISQLQDASNSLDYEISKAINGK